jgi:hypothetical protein
MTNFCSSSVKTRGWKFDPAFTASQISSIRGLSLRWNFLEGEVNDLKAPSTPIPWEVKIAEALKGVPTAPSSAMAWVETEDWTEGLETPDA